MPYEVEHSRPDYSLYDPYVNEMLALGRRRSTLSDYIDYSIGFTTRGCFRKCSFCVNKKYNKVQPHSPVKEFLDEERPYIYLWDDNFLAFSNWRDVLSELNETGKPFQFRQGLDVRLMTDEKAEALSRCRYHGDFIFAFDHIEDRARIEKKLRLWRTWTERGTRLYVLSAYDSQDEKDIESVLERVSILMKYDCLPYIMRYESYKDSPWRSLYVNIARWCNQPQFFKKKSFREFCEANQSYHKNKDTYCSAYKAMKDFEEKFPEIAARYFDLRFEEESMLKRFGRRFFSNVPAVELAEQFSRWSAFEEGKLDKDEVLQLYFSKKLDIVCGDLLYHENKLGGVFKTLFSILRDATFEEIFDAVCSLEEVELITGANVPQFSRIDSALKVPDVLCALDEPQTLAAMGMYLDYAPNKKDAANKKYGENHSKLATLMDLAEISSQGEMKVSITPFSALFNSLSEEQKNKLAAKLAFRIPVIQHILRDAAACPVSIAEYLKIFADSTKTRRFPNIRALLGLIREQTGTMDTNLMAALNNVEA